MLVNRNPSDGEPPLWARLLRAASRASLLEAFALVDCGGSAVDSRSGVDALFPSSRGLFGGSGHGIVSPADILIASSSAICPSSFVRRAQHGQSPFGSAPLAGGGKRIAIAGMAVVTGTIRTNDSLLRSGRVSIEAGAAATLFRDARLWALGVDATEALQLLSSNLKVRDAYDNWWGCLTRQPQQQIEHDQADFIGESQYIAVMSRVAEILCLALRSDRLLAEELAFADWRRDSRGRNRLNYEQFFLTLFCVSCSCLARTSGSWVDATAAAHHTQWLRDVFVVVFTGSLLPDMTTGIITQQHLEAGASESAPLLSYLHCELQTTNSVLRKPSAREPQFSGHTSSRIKQKPRTAAENPAGGPRVRTAATPLPDCNSSSRFTVRFRAAGFDHTSETKLQSFPARVYFVRGATEHQQQDYQKQQRTRGADEHLSAEPRERGLEDAPPAIPVFNAADPLTGTKRLPPGRVLHTRPSQGGLITSGEEMANKSVGSLLLNNTRGSAHGGQRQGGGSDEEGIEDFATDDSEESTDNRRDGGAAVKIGAGGCRAATPSAPVSRFSLASRYFWTLDNNGRSTGSSPQGGAAAVRPLIDLPALRGGVVSVVAPSSCATAVAGDSGAAPRGDNVAFPTASFSRTLPIEEWISLLARATRSLVVRLQVHAAGKTKKSTFVVDNGLTFSAVLERFGISAADAAQWHVDVKDGHRTLSTAMTVELREAVRSACADTAHRILDAALRNERAREIAATGARAETATAATRPAICQRCATVVIRGFLRRVDVFADL